MKNTFGNALTVTLFGESHGEAIGAVLDGLSPGMRICPESIKDALAKRAPRGDISTARREEDEIHFLSGVKGNRTTGTPLAFYIPNRAFRPEDYDAALVIPRPGHADYAAHCKYGGFEDQHGGGHFSGRITAALVAAGAVCRTALSEKGIVLGTHIQECAGIPDAPFTDLSQDIALLNEKDFPTLSGDAEEKMVQAITAEKNEGDSIGGILETVVLGMPCGVGEPWFDTVEGMLSHMLFSVPGVKGVEFGDGFALASMKGSEANDAFYPGENGKLYTKTNHNGGINGGITNGMPLLFRVCVKPTSSIAKEQKSVNLQTGESTLLSVCGRHDPAIVHRVRAVIDAVTALVLSDFLLGRFGTDYFTPSDNGKGKTV